MINVINMISKKNLQGTFVSLRRKACAELKKAGRDLDNKTSALQLIESADLSDE